MTYFKYKFQFCLSQIIHLLYFFLEKTAMIELCKQSEDSKKEWSLDRERETQTSCHVIRKFINSAIYVEKPLTATISSGNTSICQELSNEHLPLPDLQCAKTKRCTCSVEQKSCPCHANSITASEPKKNIAVSKITETKSKVSQPSLPINTKKEDSMKNWLAKKEEERKKKELEQRSLLEAKMKEKESLLEQERNNFKKWLMNKKKLEIQTKKKKEKKLEEQQLKELEKEKRQLENQLNFQLWLKKKEEALLEKKIKQQMEIINKLEKKESHLRDNEKAFNEWLKNSKNKRKPVPLNKGLQSLCSSSSVTYINPNPWNSTP